MPKIIRPTDVLAIISAILLLASTSTSAFNITRLLGQYPDFSNFNDLLTQTQLAYDINSRKTITVLAVTNDKLAGIQGKPLDVVKRLLSNHVILDYFDVLKLNKLKNTKTFVTTLYQASGVANDAQGFLDIVHKLDGSVVFGSAVKGAGLDCKLEGSVASQPYNISVLSVSQVIIAPGMDGSYSKAPAKAPPPKAHSPTGVVEVPSPAETPVDSPASASDAPALSPADGPVADAPADGPTADSPADGPVADSPADSPVADAPAGPAEGPAADAEQALAPASAAGKQVVSGISVAIAVAVASILA